MNRFRNETNAYKSLHAFDVCDSGLVPKYYGSIDRLDPSCHQPWLNDFQNDEFHPSAILLEYLVNPEPLNCVNYSKERLAKAMEALVQVHSALVVHNDIYPKNILIVPGSPERVVLMDFDIAKTFPTKELLDQDIGFHDPEPIQSCKWEIQLLESLGEMLVRLPSFRFSWLSLILRLGGRSEGGTSSQHQVLLNLASCSLFFFWRMIPRLEMKQRVEGRKKDQYLHMH